MVATASDSLSFLDDLSNDTVDYLYTGVQCIEERDGSDTVQRQYVWGQYVDELIQQRDINGGSTDYYLLSDLLYRSIALVNTSKVIQEAYDCDAYGNTLVYSADGLDDTWFTDDDVTTDDPTCQFIFTGRRFDPETSNATTQIYFYRKRYYTPEFGRFLSKDPIGYMGGMGLYQYVGGNPIVVSDALGLAMIVPTGLGIDTPAPALGFVPTTEAMTRTTQIPALPPEPFPVTPAALSGPEPLPTDYSDLLEGLETAVRNIPQMPAQLSPTAPGETGISAPLPAAWFVRDKYAWLRIWTACCPGETRKREFIAERWLCLNAAFPLPVVRTVYICNDYGKYIWEECDLKGYWEWKISSILVPTPTVWVEMIWSGRAPYVIGGKGSFAAWVSRWRMEQQEWFDPTPGYGMMA